MRALLHDAGTFTVVFANDQHGAADDAARSQVGQRVGRDVGTDGRFEGDSAAQWVVDGRCKRCGGGGFRGTVLKVHSELGQDVVGIREHIHQV